MHYLLAVESARVLAKRRPAGTFAYCGINQGHLGQRFRTAPLEELRLHVGLWRRQRRQENYVIRSETGEWSHLLGSSNPTRWFVFVLSHTWISYFKFISCALHSIARNFNPLLFYIWITSIIGYYGVIAVLFPLSIRILLKLKLLLNWCLIIELIHFYFCI